MLEITTTHYVRTLSARQLRYLHHMLAPLARGSATALAPYARLLHASGRLCEAVYVADQITSSCASEPEALFVALSVAISASDLERINKSLDALKGVRDVLTEDQHARFFVYAAIATASVGNSKEKARALLQGPAIQKVVDPEALYQLAPLLADLDDRHLTMRFISTHGDAGIPQTERTRFALLKTLRATLLEVLMNKVQDG